MTILSAIFIFIVCFALMTIFSFILGGSLVKLKTRLRLSGALLGMIAALGADTPEISSAVTALFIGQHDVGVGIIIGSSIFNIAALLGLSALVVGSLPLSRQGIIVNGMTSIIVILVLILLIYRFILPLVSLLLFLFLLVPYVIISEIKPKQMKEWSLPEKIRVFLYKAIVDTRNTSKEHKLNLSKSWSWLWLGGLAVIVIIITSIGMVHSAVFLSSAWGVKRSIVGMLILATLTSIPNVITSIRLALDNRGMAVMSESLNSNTINILFGICVPAIIFGLNTLSKQTFFSVWWLIGITVLAMFLFYLKKGFNRMSGAIVVGLYLVFVVFLIVWK